jgi:hypothetical protein
LTFDDVAQKVKDSKTKDSQQNFKETPNRFKSFWHGDIKNLKNQSFGITKHLRETK